MRAVPARGLDGEPFTGPGVDLRGDDAARVIAAAAPLLAWLDEREPGVQVRSLSLRVEGPRVLASVESTSGGRPRALRFDPPYANELRDRGRAAEHLIVEACARALTKRSR